MSTWTFDLHGRVRLDLVDPPDAAVEQVRLETGLTPTGPVGDAAAALTVRFDLRTGGAARWVGRDAAFSGDLFLLGSPGARTALPVSAITGDATIECEPAVRHVPHLLTLLNLAMARSGVLPLHAGAVILGQRTTVITGWAHGGKTSALLGLMELGGMFVADEWCYVCPDGEVLGLAHPLSLSSAQLSQVPELRRGLSRNQRLRLATTRRLSRSAALRRVADWRTDVDVPPALVFPPDRRQPKGRLDLLVLIECSDHPRPAARRIPGAEAVARLRAVLRAERAGLAADLARLDYAFPGAAAGLLESVDAREARLLEATLLPGADSQATDDIPVWLVTHPSPADIAELASCIAGIG